MVTSVTQEEHHAVSLKKRLLKAFTSSILGGLAGCTSGIPVGLATNLITQNEDLFGIIMLSVVLSSGCFISLLIAKRSMKISWHSTFKTMLLPYCLITLFGLLLVCLQKSLTENTWNFLHAWVVFYFPFILGSFPASVLCSLVTLYGIIRSKPKYSCT